MIKDTFLFLVRRFVRRFEAYLRKIKIIFIFLPSLFTCHSKCFKLFLPITVSPPFKAWILFYLYFLSRQRVSSSNCIRVCMNVRACVGAKLDKCVHVCVCVCVCARACVCVRIRADTVVVVCCFRSHLCKVKVSV